MTGGDRLVVHGRDGNKIVDEAINELKAAWQRPLDW